MPAALRASLVRDLVFAVALAVTVTVPLAVPATGQLGRFHVTVPMTRTTAVQFPIPRVVPIDEFLRFHFVTFDISGAAHCRIGAMDPADYRFEPDIVLLRDFAPAAAALA